MKIIDTFWEKRNLGVSSKEIIISKSDTIEELKKLLPQLIDTEYLIVKVPSPFVYFIEYLTAEGFEFIETIIETSLDLDRFKIPIILEKINTKVTYHEMIEFNLLFDEINKGIFNTDRIALDSKFGIDYSSRRYINWLKDELEKGNKIYNIILKDTNVGFFALKKINDEIYDNFLAGLYLNDKNFGLGFSIITKAIEEIRNRGGKRYTTHISTNNVAVFKIYSQLGFIPQEVHYVLKKHK